MYEYLIHVAPAKTAGGTYFGPMSQVSAMVLADRIKANHPDLHAYAMPLQPLSDLVKERLVTEEEIQDVVEYERRLS
jgi:hypothetical protein